MLNRKHIHVIYKKGTYTIESLIIPIGYISTFLSEVNQVDKLKKISIFSELTNASRYFRVISSKINRESNRVILTIYPNQIRLNKM